MNNTIDKNIQQQVMKLLDWPELKYAEYIHDCGVRYLSGYLPDYPQVVNQILKSERFWNWWKAHWEKRDKEYLEIIDESQESIIDAEEEYTNLHDPRTLAAAIYLNGQVLQESYATLITEITQDQEVLA